jgi:predicted amidohydrolase
VAKNLRRLELQVVEAARQGIDLVVFPETDYCYGTIRHCICDPDSATGSSISCSYQPMY